MQRRRLTAERVRDRLPEDAVDRVAVDLLALDSRIEGVALFGSYARRRVRGCSDLDLAVLTGPEDAISLDLRCDWREWVSTRLGGYPVDLSVTGGAPLLLRWNIRSEGRLLRERRTGAWREFQQWTTREWRDRARVRDRYWQRFLHRETAEEDEGGNPTSIQRLVRRCEHYLEQLGSIRRSDADFLQDIGIQWQVERGLQLVAQACIDIADEILYRMGLPEPETAPAAMAALETAGLLDHNLGAAIVSCVKFRNILLHDYADLDPAEVLRRWRSDTIHYKQFCGVVRNWLARSAGVP